MVSKTGDSDPVTLSTALTAHTSAPPPPPLDVISTTTISSAIAPPPPLSHSLSSLPLSSSLPSGAATGPPPTLSLTNVSSTIDLIHHLLISLNLHPKDIATLISSSLPLSSFGHLNAASLTADAVAVASLNPSSSSNLNPHPLHNQNPSLHQPVGLHPPVGLPPSLLPGAANPPPPLGNNASPNPSPSFVPPNPFVLPPAGGDTYTQHIAAAAAPLPLPPSSSFSNNPHLPNPNLSNLSSISNPPPNFVLLFFSPILHLYSHISPLPFILYKISPIFFQIQKISPLFFLTHKISLLFFLTHQISSLYPLTPFPHLSPFL